MWTLTLTLSNGTTDHLYCATRQDARDRARFYRLNSTNLQPGDYPIGHLVTGSKISKG